MASQPTSPGWLIGRIGGVPIHLARGFALIAVLVAVLFGPQVAAAAPGLGLAAYLVSLGYALLLFISVLVHESAHALTGRALGQHPREIVINFWGGHTQFAQAADSPWRTVLVSLAGPVSNGVLGGLAAMAWIGAGPNLPPVVEISLFFFAAWNLLLAGFNLLPGLPLDGGRVLEAAVWQVTGRRWKGTLAAGWVGRVLAGAVVGYALLPLLSGGRPSLLSMVWALFIAAMLWQAAGQAVNHARMRSRADEVDLRALMHPAVTVDEQDSVATALQRVSGQQESVVLVRGPHGLTGMLDPQALAHVPPQRLEQTPVTAVMRPLDTHDVIGVDQTGDQLFDAMTHLRSGMFLVQDGDRVVGVLGARLLLDVLVSGRA